MKKFFAVLLLIICSSAAFLAAFAFNTIMAILTFSFAAALIIALFPLCALGYGASFWARIFMEKFAVRTHVFMIISHILPLIATAAYWINFARLMNSGHFGGILGGAFEFTAGVMLTVTAMLYPVSSTIWYIYTKNIGKVLKYESEN